MRRLHIVVAALLILTLGTTVTVSASVPKCNGKPATNPGSLTGTAQADVIIGTPGDDEIDGLAGNDTICGLGGNDTITGGNDDDWISGGDGDDNLDTTFADTLGNDVFKGGNGNDIMGTGQAKGNDTYDGEAGNDWIKDYEDSNVANGGPGNDDIDVYGEAYGDAGDDPHVEAQESVGNATNGYANGGSGSDGQTTGPSGQSGVIVNGGTADGGSGNDRVFAVFPGSTGLGGSGSDFVSGSSSGDQLLDCGAAYDYYVFTAGDTVRRCESNSDPNS
jgi:Ca2+-binding RTX toxin-like protein